uniref:Protein kinase domain-containing protein n=1 Tax=Strigamia maritima TaxID=126957 RepID=T1IQJ8_STRMM
LINVGNNIALDNWPYKSGYYLFVLESSRTPRLIELIENSATTLEFAVAVDHVKPKMLKRGAVPTQWQASLAKVEATRINEIKFVMSMKKLSCQAFRRNTRILSTHPQPKIIWKEFSDSYSAELRANNVFQSKDSHWQQLLDRVTEHNNKIDVIGMYVSMSQIVADKMYVSIREFLTSTPTEIKQSGVKSSGTTMNEKYLYPRKTFEWLDVEQDVKEWWKTWDPDNVKIRRPLSGKDYYNNEKVRCDSIVPESNDPEFGEIVRQIFSYMASLAIPFGMVTTYVRTWLLKMDKNSLYISKPIPRESTSTKILQYWAYTFFQSLYARRDADLYSTYYKPQDENDLSLDKVLGIGRNGVVHRACFGDAKIAVKSAYILNTENVSALENEEEIYRSLLTLQGTVIPRFLFKAMKQEYLCLGLELLDHPIDVDRCTDKEVVVDCLRAIHMQGVLHNDIRTENILTRKFQLLILGFLKKTLAGLNITVICCSYPLPMIGANLTWDKNTSLHVTKNLNDDVIIMLTNANSQLMSVLLGKLRSMFISFQE